MMSLHRILTINKEDVVRWLSVAEGCTILLTIVAFWHHSPPIRDAWVWLLWLPVIFSWLRIQLCERIWTANPLQNWLFGFVLLAAFNFAHAPYAREDFIVLMSRPLLGMWIYTYAVEHARIFRRLHGLVAVMVVLAAVVALLALTATDWQTAEKAAGLQGIIDLLPVFDYREAARQNSAEICNALLQPFIGAPCFRPADLLANSLLGFNPNEIAGALAWLMPLMAALALAKPQHTAPDRLWTSLRIAAGVVALLLLLALILGQSRFALAGVLLSCGLVAYKMISQALVRRLIFAALAVLVLLQLSFVLNLNPAPADGTPQAGVSTRDQRTFSTRFDLWERGFRMMRDYPLTGIGMSMYRSAVGTDRYAIEYYVLQQTVPPHAHNEWAQIAADLGVPGLILYLIWQVTVLKMLWRGWRGGDPYGRIVAGAVFAGLFAHAIYATGDAITLWDRFQFIQWTLVGLAGAQWLLIQHPATSQQP